MQSYFSNRKQCVCHDDHKSDFENINCGVPQGSTLGPLCFGVYINDLPNAVSENCVLFADDAAFIIDSSDLADLFRRIQQLFNDIARYLEYNCLAANDTKSKLMMFSSHVVAELPDFVFSHDKFKLVLKWQPFIKMVTTVSDYHAI